MENQCVYGKLVECKNYRGRIPYGWKNVMVPGTLTNWRGEKYPGGKEVMDDPFKFKKGELIYIEQRQQDKNTKKYDEYNNKTCYGAKFRGITNNGSIYEFDLADGTILKLHVTHISNAFYPGSEHDIYGYTFYEFPFNLPDPFKTTNEIAPAEVAPAEGAEDEQGNEGNDYVLPPPPNYDEVEKEDIENGVERNGVKLGGRTRRNKSRRPKSRKPRKPRKPKKSRRPRKSRKTRKSRR
jgi:hypothetical protein